jgi:hypothetical protein
MNRLLKLALLSAAVSVLLLSVHAPTNALSQKPPQFVGAQACAECHRDIVTRQQQSMMSKALVPAADCQVLRDHPQLKFQQGRFTYRITRTGTRSLYEFSDGQQTITAPLLYAFGQGFSGQTYVYQHAGVTYESRVSFYQAIKGLDITLGHQAAPPATLLEAGGRSMSLDEARNCFGCHTTNASITAGAEQLEIKLNHAPGIRCESCHGPAETHLAAVRNGQTKTKTLKSLRALDADDLSQQVCGQCHRSVEEVAVMPDRNGLSNVRFQPYRIFNSRCYSTDARIGCTACHDPHGPLERNAAFYDTKCLACHQVGKDASVRLCKVGKRDCASCHMPKLELPGAHFKFTDHRIRIARAGAPYPN